MRRRLFLITLSMLIIMSLLFAACAPKTSNNGGTESEGTENKKEEMVLNFSLDAEPPQLDPQKGSDLTSIFVLGHVLEGLTRVYDGKIQPGMAENWEVSSDGLTYTFHLRDAKWSDGVPVTAQDFEYSILRLLDPNTAGAYSEIMGFLIKNGEKFYKGEADKSEVGVKAIDEKTLEIQLEAPTGYFLRVLGFLPYWPSRSDIVEKFGEAFSSEADKMVYNGPFIIKEWKHEEGIVLAKNENYWDKDKIKADIINVYIIPDPKTALNMFETGEILAANIPADMTDLYIQNGTAKFFPSGGSYYLQFNFNHKDEQMRKIISNKNFRKAISYALDRESFAKAVAKNGALPATRFVPPTVSGVNDKYTKEYPYDVLNLQIDQAKAKEHLELALKELNITSEQLPVFKLLTRDDPVRRIHMEAVQDMLYKTLGIKTDIVQVPKKQFFQLCDDSDFDISYSNWYPDYDDPMTYIDVFMTGNGVNRGRYSNSAYDDAVKTAKYTPDLKLRAEKMLEAEKILLDDLPIIPIFWDSTAYVKSDKLVNYIRSMVGADPDLIYAYIEE